MLGLKKEISHRSPKLESGFIKSKFSNI